MHTRSLIDCQNGNVPIFILIRIFKYSSISIQAIHEIILAIRYWNELKTKNKKQNELNGNESIPGAL